MHTPIAKFASERANERQKLEGASDDEKIGQKENGTSSSKGKESGFTLKENNDHDKRDASVSKAKVTFANVDIETDAKNTKNA